MGDDFKSPEDNVYTFKDVVFRINQTQLGVSKIVLSAFDNAPPIVNVTAATVPYDSVTEIAGLANSLAEHSKIQKWAGANYTEVRLEFKAVSKQDTQTVLLDNWVLLPSGLEPVAVGNTIVATYRLAHPATLGDINTLSAYNLPIAMETPAIVGTNPYDCFMDALTKFLNKLSQIPRQDAEESVRGVNDKELWDLNKQTIAAVKESVDALKKHTRWSGQQEMPYQPAWANCSKVKATLWSYVHMFNSTPYDAFNQFLGDFLLVSSGVFSDAPVDVYPFVPWGPPVGYIYDSQIENMAVPPGDRAAIGTIVVAPLNVHKEFGYMPPGAYGQPGVEGNSAVPTESCAYGWYLNFVGKLIGKIQEVRVPDWMSMVGMLLAKDVDELYTENDLNNLDNASSPGDPAAAMDALNNDATFTNTVKAYAEDALFNVFGMGLAVSMTTRLMIRVPTFNAFGSDMLRPGVVLAVRAVETDKELMYFYVNRVEHTIDIDGSQAYTNLTGAFYRTPEGVVGGDGTVLITPDTVKNGKPSNMYKTFRADML